MDDRANILRGMKVCRFCLNSDGKLTNIYESHSKDHRQTVPLPLQIMACVAIEVFSNDGMPQLICEDCRTHTLQAYTFKSNCKKADDALKLFLATGQLTKPVMRKVVDDEEANLEPVHHRRFQPKVINPIHRTAETSEQKKIKIENSDVITLNFSQESNQLQRQNPEEYILGMESEPEHEEHIPTANNFGELEDETKLNPILKVNQVRTECFPCPHCDRSFPLKQLLDLHVVNHERERSFECEECNRRFYTKYDLNKHVQTHNDYKPFACVVCQKTFSRESLLHRHEKIHNDVPKYLCSQCDRTFLNRQNLDNHMEKHKKKRPYTCKQCNKSFVFKQGLERHEMVHTNEKPHKCNYCEASFTSAIKLTRHITSHAGLRPYPCKLCGRTFLLSHHLTRHMRSHYAAQCPSGDEFIGQHKCDICSMSFRRKDSLINHSAIHSMVNLRCVICNTTFENAKMVKEHITTHLSGLPFPCEKCDYSFDTQEQLEEHELKHAEMEYEDQIEKEVVEEARQAAEQDINEEFEDEEVEEYDGEVAEFTITNDINNPEVVRRSKRPPRIKNYAQFLKDELGSDLEEEIPENTQQEQEVVEVVQESKDTEGDLEDTIKPIIRSEGTKVYTRKSAPGQRCRPVLNPEALRVAPLDQITQPDMSSLENLGINPEALNAMPNKKFVNMKLGDKNVKVQKFIVTKEEMKAMAKQGILEMKGGTVVLKNAGQPIFNATLKPAHRVDIESIISDAKPSNAFIKHVKTYQRKSTSVADESQDYIPEESLETQGIITLNSNTSIALEETSIAIE